MEKPRLISKAELVSLIDQACKEEWKSLALFGGPSSGSRHEDLVASGWDAQHVFQVSGLDALPSEIRSLKTLTHFACNYCVGSDDSSLLAIASLDQLVSLNLGANALGRPAATVLAQVFPSLPG